MMTLSDVHAILFNAYILFSLALGVWAAVIAGRNQPISGNYWGALATMTALAAVILLVGLIQTLQGLVPADGRLGLYFLYMMWLVVIMPGLFTLMRGRDDRSAALAFALLAFFNAGVAFSMIERMVVGPWVTPIIG